LLKVKEQHDQIVEGKKEKRSLAKPNREREKKK